MSTVTMSVVSTTVAALIILNGCLPTASGSFAAGGWRRSDHACVTEGDGNAMVAQRLGAVGYFGVSRGRIRNRVMSVLPPNGKIFVTGHRSVSSLSMSGVEGALSDSTRDVLSGESAKEIILNLVSSGLRYDSYLRNFDYLLHSTSTLTSSGSVWKRDISNDRNDEAVEFLMAHGVSQETAHTEARKEHLESFARVVNSRNSVGGATTLNAVD